MVITKLMGGLGNQMFQYAAGLSLAKRQGATLKMQMGYFEEPKAWPYQLDLFHVEAKPLTIEESSYFHTYVDRRIGRAILKLASHKALGDSRPAFLESDFAFNEDFNQLKGPRYIEGYWQSPRYFEGIAEDLKKHFQPIQRMSDLNLSFVEQMNSAPSVSLHIRRGDYLTSSASKVHGLCGLDYYQNAVSYLNERYEGLKYIVFSDDAEWVAENLDIGSKFELVNHNSGSNSYWDMILMSHAKHHIIANSTFSWWGAWLSKEKGTTIAPNPWFADNKNTKDLLPKDWIQIG